LSSEAVFPSQIYDCKAAIRYIRANAQKYHLDGRRIGAWGGSAGGHLVAMLGTSAGVKELEDLSMGSPESSCEVQAVVDWCGPTEDFIRMDEEFQKSGLGVPDHSSLDSPESRLIGKHITEAPKLVKFASPMTYINKNIPFFLIQHGALDQVVPVEQSICFAAELVKTAGADKVILEIIPDLHHHGDPGFETEKMVNRVFAFLDNHLK
jgi:acetyl esterase/lipase